MFDPHRDRDTICALSTPPGRGGLAIVRVSGESSFSIGAKICPFLPSSPESHRIYFGVLIDPESGVEIDQVLVSCFAHGKSYTGEQTLEISCHGGEPVYQEILRVLVNKGSRIASPGEFSYRSFVNGKMDLVQAEGVLALIESQSRRAAQLAMRQLGGGLSKVLLSIEDDLLWVLAQLEASIDFSSEDIEVVDNGKLKTRVESLLARVDQLCNSYGSGRLIKEGIRIGILGRPNAGKSSLLNVLLGEDKAIVTDIAGTTRDPVEGELLVAGVKVNFVDTAGMREDPDSIEKFGVLKSKEIAAAADLIFYVVDLSEQNAFMDETIISGLDSSKVVVIGNKVDKAQVNFGSLKVSAKTGKGLGQIWKLLENKVKECLTEQSAVVQLNRHYELLTKCQDSLARALTLVNEESSPEFASAEVQRALINIQETLGKRFDDQILDRVFSEFCIGK